MICMNHINNSRLRFDITNGSWFGDKRKSSGHTKSRSAFWDSKSSWMFQAVPIQQCHHCRTDLLDETPFCKIASSSLGIWIWCISQKLAVYFPACGSLQNIHCPGICLKLWVTNKREVHWGTLVIFVTSSQHQIFSLHFWCVLCIEILNSVKQYSWTLMMMIKGMCWF